MPGTLFVVGTPIGNLEDITLRALRVLRDVDLVAAEDTRRTARLLAHYQIRTPTTSFHEHNERRKTPLLLSRLREGARIALVSDAGMPALSDPGAHLVRAALEAGIDVRVVPGPSAVTAALAVAGLPATEFTFLGFPPARGAPRQEWLSRLAAEPRPVIVFEAPHRLRRTLEDLEQVLHTRRVVVAHELTKTHENLVVGPIEEVRRRLVTPRGEYVLVIDALHHGARSGSEVKKLSQVDLPIEEIRQELCRITEDAGSINRRKAIKLLARRWGLSVNSLYRLVSRAEDARS